MPTLLILDANAFFSGKQLSDVQADHLFITSEIEEEVSVNKNALLILESLKAQNKLMVMDPENSYYKHAKQTAINTGDQTVISEADLGIIALALDLKSKAEYKEWEIKVVSSDFAVQNVCKTLGIGYLSFKHGTIKRKIIWNFKCKDCGKSFRSPSQNECDVCGGIIIRTSQSKKNKNTSK